MTILMTASGISSADLTARVDRNPVSLGETLRLIIEIDGRLDARALDTSELEKDFEVLGTASNSRIHIKGGKQQILSQLYIDLLPRNTGDLTIPALEFSGDTTRPVTVTVKPAGTDGQAGEVFVEMEIDDLAPYVQQPVILTIKLYFSVPIVEGNLTDPDDERFQIRRLGDDGQYSAERHGVRYQVIERRFAVTPRQSGSVDIEGVTFDGRATVDSGLGGFSSRGKRYRIRTEPLTLDVKPTPQAATGKWFPAGEVSISEQWPEATPSFTVGEAITRTIRIEAHSVFGEQIPKVELLLPEDIQGYADKASINTGMDNGTPVGTREQRIALVPVKPGSLVLPPVELNWWDTTADRPRVARLAQRVIEVQPAPVVDSAPISNQQLDIIRSNELEPTTPSNPDSSTAAAEHSDTWRWLSIILGILWLATIGVLIGRKTAGSRNKPKESDTGQGIPLRQIQAVCRRGDAHEIRAVLIEWARTARPARPPTGLDELAQNCDDDAVQHALTSLDAACYASSSQAFDGEEFWRVIKNWLKNFTNKQGSSKPEDATLPPLYTKRVTGEY